MNPFDLSGRTAIVTGAAGGLGRAFALALGEAGAAVVGLDCDSAGLTQTREHGERKGISMTTLVVDVAVADQVDGAISGLLQSAPADILVNYAGIATLPGRTHEISVADWDRAIAVNLRSMFLVTRAVLPNMLRARAGSIVNRSDQWRDQSNRLRML